MANKRELKKTINFICSDLFSECIAYAIYNNKKEEDLDTLLSSILIIHNENLSRVSHLEPGLKPKHYFDNLRKNFSSQINEIIDNIANL